MVLRSGALQDPLLKNVKYREYHAVPLEVRMPAWGRTSPPDDESPAANPRTCPPCTPAGRLGPEFAVMPALFSLAVIFKH